MRRLAALLPMLILLGCGGDKRSVADVERGRGVVVASLDSWKANEPAAKLKTAPDPIDFSEELRATHTLTDYTLGKVDGSDPNVVRCTVTLQLKDRKGKASEREAVYAVALKSPIVVSRDPYY